MAAIQCSLREDHTDEFAGPLSHMYGTSTANQRIESWWSIFRKQRTQFWMDLFSDLRDRHYFNGTHEHKCLVRYVFLGIFQKELDEHRELWNNHTIRPVRQSLSHLENRRPCTTCLTGLVEGIVDSKWIPKCYRSSKTFCHLQTVCVEMIISKHILPTWRDRASSFHPSTGQLLLTITLHLRRWLDFRIALLDGVLALNWDAPPDGPCLETPPHA
ncbi:uncharacterized protein LOC132467566 [Gadus macrocephalus]|uniref:uncharacterized protein LOC132467566 n=1 Tax=Gadus macrocephalus TaxID=80720 RepID=UPI0028CB72DC|nr:uncharacterized protein LOC132467566 [Gadus macrocephalus]